MKEQYRPLSFFEHLFRPLRRYSTRLVKESPNSISNVKVCASLPEDMSKVVGF